MRELNREVNDETALDDFKEELWDAVVKFREPLLMGTGLDEKARKELLSKLVELRKAQSTTRDDECKGSSTLRQKTIDKIIECVKGDKVETSNIRLEQGEARVGRIGWRQRGRISDDNDNAPK